MRAPSLYKLVLWYAVQHDHCSGKTVGWLDAWQKTVFFEGEGGVFATRQDGRVPHQLSLKLVPEAFFSDVNRELTDHLASASSRGYACVEPYLHVYTPLYVNQ